MPWPNISLIFPEDHRFPSCSLSLSSIRSDKDLDMGQSLPMMHSADTPKIHYGEKGEKEEYIFPGSVAD